MLAWADVNSFTLHCSSHNPLCQGQSPADGTLPRVLEESLFTKGLGRVDGNPQGMVMSAGASNKGSLRRLDLKGAVATYNPERENTRRGKGSQAGSGLQEGSRGCRREQSLGPSEATAERELGNRCPSFQLHLPSHPLLLPSVVWTHLQIRKQRNPLLQTQNCQPAGTQSRMERGNGQVWSDKWKISHTPCFSPTLQRKHLSYSTDLIMPSLHLKAFNGSLLPQMMLEPLNTSPAL